jgi:hypothetical protein
MTRVIAPLSLTPRRHRIGTRKGDSVLYARCSYCGGVQPLWCSGGFGAHMPTPVEAGAGGAYCPVCGPKSPTFACGFCGMQQYLALPSAAGPSYAAGPGQASMQVVQMPANASKSSVVGEFAKGLGEGLGRGATQAMFGPSG